MKRRFTLDDLQKKGFSINADTGGITAKPNSQIIKEQKAGTLYVLNVVPFPKPRMTRSDKWNKRPVVIRYRESCDALRNEAGLKGFILPDSGFHVTFYMPIPKTHLKRELELKPHQVKPDCDNMLKALFDALSKNDQTVWDCRVTKLYSSIPRIEIRIL